MNKAGVGEQSYISHSHNLLMAILSVDYFVSQGTFANPMSTLTTRKTILGALVIFSVLVMFILLNHFRTEVLLIFTGIAISISITPAFNWLGQHKLPRFLSALLIYLCPVTGFLGFIIFVIPQTIKQAVVFVPRFESIYTATKSNLQNSSYPFLRQWVSSLPVNLSSIFSISLSGGANGAGLISFNSTLDIAQNILYVLFSLSIVLLISFYWTIEGERVEYAFLLLLPVEKRESTREILTDIENRVGGFMRGQGLLAIAIGVLSFAAYFIIGLPSVLSLAFLAGVFEMIPVIGPTLGAIPAMLVAMESDPVKILWVVLATISIQFFENHFLFPRIMQKTVGVNPIVTILSIIGFGALFGFSGLLMAIPLAAIAQVILDRFLLHPQVESIVEMPIGRDRLSKLSYDVQEFVQDVRKLVRRKETGTASEDRDEIEDAMESIATELDRLLAQTIQPENSP